MSMTLTLIKKHRIAVVPEYEGGWQADMYGDEESPQYSATGSTPYEAVKAVMAKYEEDKDHPHV